MHRGQVLFTYFHFAASRALTQAVLDSGELPLLTPMSEVAGRMAVQGGAASWASIPEAPVCCCPASQACSRAKCSSWVGGVVGTNAAKVAAGMGARVSVMDVDLARLRYLEDVMPANVSLLFSTRYAVRKQIEDSDLVIGTVLIPGKKAPRLVMREDLKRMRPGSVIVDVAVD